MPSEPTTTVAAHGEHDHEDISPPPLQSEVDDESGSDAGGDDTSTLEFSHESFSTLQSRVQRLVLETIWSDANEENVTIERLKGGGYNRIIGVARRTAGEPSNDLQYILRLPRFEDVRLDRDVANLQFLHHHSTIPAPTVITFDTSTENQLDGPYMIQERIVGASLHSIFLELTQEDQCRVARDVGKVVNQMLAVQSNVAGVLTFTENETSLNAPIHVTSYPSIQPEEQPVPYSKAHTTRSVLELLKESFQNQKEYSLKKDPDDVIDVEKMDAFSTMASELDTDGWLENLPNCLAHLDFAPRNILVDPTSGPDESIIKAVLDWDSAVLSPIFMACAPPAWLWGWREDDDEDERNANDLPPDPHNRQMKQIFEAAAGEEYMKFAYEPVYRLARRLLRFAILGIQSNQDYYDSDDMLEEWERVRAEAGSRPSEPAKGSANVDSQSASSWWRSARAYLQTVKRKIKPARSSTE